MAADNLQRPVAHPRLAQRGLGIFQLALEPSRQRCIQVHLKQKVHAATQIETELHRRRAKAAQPVRGGRRQIERDDVIAAQTLLDHLFAAQLLLFVAQSDQQRLAVGLAGKVANRGGVERRLNLLEHIGVDHHRTALPRELDRRVGGVEVGGGVDKS